MDLSERGTNAARHPWEIARRDAYRNVLAHHDALAARRVLDVGAGDGWLSQSLLDDLSRAEELVCWDINYAESDLDAGDSRVTMVMEAPSPGFELVLLLDVIEHIDNVQAFFDDELRPLLSSGTSVMVSVPAYPALFGNHDRALGHFRRYGRRQLLTEVASLIEVHDHGSLFASLVPPRAASIAVERLRPGRDQSHGVGEWSGGAAMTRIVSGVLGFDARVTRALGRRGARLPGLSHWAFGTVR